jgi:precorrin-4/cobalt-precorrin-4 C11-methyltransferase
MVGRVFGARDFKDSRLYHAEHHHVLRPKAKL